MRVVRLRHRTLFYRAHVAVSLRSEQLRATFPNTGPGEGSLSNYRVVSIPDCLCLSSVLREVENGQLVERPETGRHVS
jgi:hypothetical protein